ncbi:hypothetical protein Tco_0296248 [Tanacetum coccineum]
MDNTNPPSPHDSSTSLIIEKVCKLNSILDSLNFVPSSSSSKIVCKRGKYSDVMLVELIKKYGDSSKEELEEDDNVEGEEELGVEYFDKFPTRSKLAYHKYLMYALIPSLFLRNPIIVGGSPSNLKIPCNIGHLHVGKAYIDLNSPINIMTRMQYNWIMRRQLEPREDPKSLREISYFIGRVRGMHVFVGNFTYVSDFVIVEDISLVIDPRLSQVVLGKPFVELSNMTYDLSLGIVKFINGANELAYKMPHKIEQFNSLTDMEKDHTQSVYFRNEEDKRRVDYVVNKILGFYKECFELGPKYITGLKGSSSSDNANSKGVTLYLIRRAQKFFGFSRGRFLDDDLADLSVVLDPLVQFRRTSLTGFPAQSIRSSNAIALDSPYLLVLITGTSQSRQHESRKSPTKSLFDVGSRRISIVTMNTKEYHSDVLAIITRIMRRTY